jgi:hypothetical protein
MSGGNSWRWRILNFKNQRGDNEINAWAKAQGPKLRAHLNAFVLKIAALDRPLTRADNVGQLRKTGPCHGHGFIEFRIKVNNVHYRPIGWYGPGEHEITLLAGAIEKGGDFEPRNVCVTARNNKNLVIAASGRYTVDHDFS